MKFKKKVTTRENTSEYLSQDILEEDFVNVWSGIFTVQSVLGASRVEARDRFVSPPNVCQKIYTIVHLIISICTCFISVYCYMIENYSDPKSYRLVFTLAIFNAFAYSSHVIDARFIKSKVNVGLYVKMQKIDRLMRIANNKYINRKMYVINTVTIWLSIGIVVIMFLCACIGGLLLMFAYVGLVWCISVSIFEFSYCSNLVIYFLIRARFIDSILINFIEGKPTNKLDANRSIKETYRYMVAQSHNFDTDDIDLYLIELFDCFQKYQDYFNYPIAVFFVNYFTFIVSGMQHIINGMKVNILSTHEGIIVPTFLLATGGLTLFFCIRFEKYYREIKEIKRNTVTVLSITLDGPLRNKAKRMLNRIDFAPPRFSVYGMWHVDGLFMMQFLNVVSTVFVTLLQFALL